LIALEGRAMQVLDADTFDPFIGGPGLRMVVFGAENCRPSRRQTQEMDAMKHASLAAIDALNHDDVRRRMDVLFLPTTFVFRDGLLQKSLLGYQPVARIEAMPCAATRPLAAAA
jgi:hypothetical protein